MDITETLAPKSDQLDAVDLLSGPRTFTVERVTKGNAEQPINVHFAEFPRPWRPGVNQRRVLGNVWGTDSSQWPGRRLTLFCDQEVAYGGQKVGGIRVSHMSGITKRTGTPIIPTRGKSTIYNVDPLLDAPPTAPEPAPEDLAAQVVSALKDATTEAEVREWGNRANSRGLLDVQIEGETVRNHVTHRLAEIAEEQQP